MNANVARCGLETACNRAPKLATFGVIYSSIVAAMQAAEVQTQVLKAAEGGRAQ